MRLLCLRQASMTPAAVALMTAVTPPDCAYSALRGPGFGAPASSHCQIRFAGADRPVGGRSIADPRGLTRLDAAGRMGAHGGPAPAENHGK